MKPLELSDLTRQIRALGNQIALADRTPAEDQILEPLRAALRTALLDLERRGTPREPMPGQLRIRIGDGVHHAGEPS